MRATFRLIGGKPPLHARTDHLRRLSGSWPLALEVVLNVAGGMPRKAIGLTRSRQRRGWHDQHGTDGVPRAESRSRRCTQAAPSARAATTDDQQVGFAIGHRHKRAPSRTREHDDFDLDIRRKLPDRFGEGRANLLGGGARQKRGVQQALLTVGQVKCPHRQKNDFPSTRFRNGVAQCLVGAEGSANADDDPTSGLHRDHLPVVPVAVASSDRLADRRSSRSR